MTESTLRRHDAADAARATRPAVKIAAVVLFAIATAVGARISVPLPFTPVPMTLQTLFVLLSGALLGPALGATSQLAYLAAGVAGFLFFLVKGLVWIGVFVFLGKGCEW